MAVAAPPRNPFSRSGERFALLLAQPFRRVRLYVERYIQARTPRQPLPVTITRNRVYIVPTMAGYGFAAMLLVMLLGAMNFSNSMAFALTFLLAGIGLIAMHHTHANLVNIRALRLQAKPVFAGQSAEFELELENPTPKARWSLAAAWQLRSDPRWFDIGAAGERSRLSLPLPARRRGWLAAPRIAIATEFPLGLFVAWTWLDLEAACLVFPRPATRGLAPPPVPVGYGGTRNARAGHEEFDGLRAYQRGDTASRIHWKSLPRLQTPMVKHFQDGASPGAWLDWDALPPGWNVEQRLEQLTRWIIDAEADGQRYGLRLPNLQRPPAQGDAHARECLTALALFGAN